jgi:hypothetical protein
MKKQAQSMQNDYEEPTPRQNETVQLPVIVYFAEVQ